MRSAGGEDNVGEDSLATDSGESENPGESGSGVNTGDGLALAWFTGICTPTTVITALLEMSFRYSNFITNWFNCVQSEEKKSTG